MEMFIKKLKTSTQDGIASPSHEPDDPPTPPHEPDDAQSQEQNDTLTEYVEFISSARRNQLGTRTSVSSWQEEKDR